MNAKVQLFSTYTRKQAKILIFAYYLHHFKDHSLILRAESSNGANANVKSFTKPFGYLILLFATPSTCTYVVVTVW